MEVFKDKPFWERQDTQISLDDLNIILLAHVQQPRGYVNQKQLQCSETERFSIEEFNQIYQGIVNAGYYVKAVYFNELDFITDYTEHSERFENCLIYNLARNGLGDNKKTIIPAFCELVGLKYTTSSSLPCSLCRNKYYFTTLLQATNIPVPQSWLLTDAGSWVNGAPPSGTKVICKPCSESASQGITEANIMVADSNIRERFIGNNIIVQEYIEGLECEVPVFKIGNTVNVLSPVGIDLMGRCILDEQTSTDYSYNFYKLSEKCSTKVINAIKNYAEKAFRTMNMAIYGRIDFRISNDETPYIFDISTTPYTTKHSSFAFDFAEMGYEYSDIYRAIITASLINKSK